MDFHQMWYVDIVEIWFRIANGHISSLFDCFFIYLFIFLFIYFFYIIFSCFSHLILSSLQTNTDTLANSVDPAVSSGSTLFAILLLIFD